MQLTLDKQNERDVTFWECFEYLEDALSAHYLLRKEEREECVEAV